MKTIQIKNSTLDSSNVVLGLMRIAAMSDVEIDTLVRTAIDEGINTFDHADIYGSERHECERRFGEAIVDWSALRGSVLLQSKVGIREGFFDFSREHILRSVDESLAALKTDYLDLLLLHRPDTLVEPDEVAEAFDLLEATGKVRNFGVSNHTPGQIELLKSSLKQPLVVNQMQLSITHAPVIASGVAMNMAGLDQSVSRDNGVLDYSRLHGMTVQAWSPFQKAFFDGVFLDDWENFPELNQTLQQLASHYSVTPTAIAVAWITRHPARMQVVLGTTNPARVREAAAGSDIPLTRPEWYGLFTAAGHTLP